MYNSKEIEPKILEFWNSNKIYEKAKDKVKKGEKFYFLDGPPYTSGKVHIGTAWNKALKDCFIRYKRLQGVNIWDRAGYDMHGLPTENATEKELGLKNKDEIEKFGVGKFTKACKELAVRNLKLMNEDFKKLGVWMDFDNAYQSISNEFIEGEWWLIKRAHEKKRLYEGEKTMHWCASCATSLAKHELEYKNITDDSIYVKFPLVGKENEFLIIYTTTPWTIFFNLGVMVHPDLEYSKVKYNGEIWIIAKELIKNLEKITDKTLEIIETVKGKDLEGIKYHHPFEKYYDYSELKKNEKVFSVVLSKNYVTLDTGSGLVHMAPGCGQEDYEVGHKYKIPPFNNIDEYGIFPKETKKFTGLKAKKNDQDFIQTLEQDGFLITSEKIDHEYPHCWRCKNPVIFRTTTQWFFKVEDLKENMRELNKSIKWIPNWAGNKQFDSWLENLRDNGITRQRYWGTPMPIWTCKECNKYKVIGSIKELEELSNTKLENLHIPLIDDVEFKCECGGTKKRIPDILDVWVDAGSTSWTCLDFPQRDDLFQQYYPADFILEGKDQIRGWFNLLLINSMLAFENASYKTVYMHGFVQDSQGRKMSKSLGNYILPEEVIEKYGSDTLRYYLISGANPGLDINYNFEDMKVKHKNLSILWNVQNYLITQTSFLKKNPSKLNDFKLSIEEDYILSLLNSKIETVTNLFENYELNEIPNEVEEILLELSRTYVKLVREKLTMGDEKEKEGVLFTIYETLMKFLQLFSPISPFITEEIYQNLKKEFNLKEESIHLLEWPKINKIRINKKLEENMNMAKQIIQNILSLRDKEKMGVRWPLQEATVYVFKDNENVLEAAHELKDLIKSQVNIKELKLQRLANNEEADENFKYGKIILNIETTPELEKEGYVRELIRRIQNMRKKAGLKKQDSIVLHISSKYGISKFEKEIMEKVGASSLDYTDTKAIYSSLEKIKEQEFLINFNLT
tara:strand:+ start:4096 stop:6990 length:2895 start_codon:yes stop_codon:yes gene_type:complete